MVLLKQSGDQIPPSTKVLGLVALLSILLFGLEIYLTIKKQQGGGRSEPEEQVPETEEEITTDFAEPTVTSEVTSEEEVPKEASEEKTVRLEIPEEIKEEVEVLKESRKGPILSYEELQENLSIVRQYIRKSTFLSDEELIAHVLSSKRNFLMIGVKDGNYKLTLALLKLGAPFDGTDRRGLYPVHIAAENGYKNILQLLVEWGADINKKDLTGYTVLHRATMRGKLSVVKWILKKNVDVNQSNTAGWTAMHLAASMGNVEIAKLLVGAGANVNAKDIDGWTPLYLAILYKRGVMEEYIKSIGGI